MRDVQQPSCLLQYVSDLVRGLMAVMDNEEGLIGPFNLGNPGEFTIMELAQLVKEVVNPKVEIVLRENTADDPKVRYRESCSECC